MCSCVFFGVNLSIRRLFLALLCDPYGVTGVACITGALLAKRGESSISERSETCAKRETRGGEK